MTSSPYPTRRAAYRLLPDAATCDRCGLTRTDVALYRQILPPDEAACSWARGSFCGMCVRVLNARADAGGGWVVA